MYVLFTLTNEDEIGSTEQVEVTGYSCNWKLLEDMSEDEIDEIYGAIWEV